MGAPRKLERPVDLHLMLPAPLVGEVHLVLYSEAHGGVPKGRLSEFAEAAFRRHLAELKKETQQ